MKAVMASYVGRTKFKYTAKMFFKIIKIIFLPLL